MKSVVIIGSGNLAEALARAVANSELELVQIYARNSDRARVVAKLGKTHWTSSPSHLSQADVYIICVSDKAVANLSATLPIPTDAVVLHTAGSVSLGTIHSRFSRRGVIYPLQTFTKGVEVDFSDIPLFIESSNNELREQLESFASKLSRMVIYADSAHRAQLHLAGVFACNFTNHMYAVGERIAIEAGFSFEVLKPLIAQTAAKALAAHSPVDVQTGPAVRNDFETRALHGEMLSFDLHLKNIYSTISQSIWETSKKI